MEELLYGVAYYDEYMPYDRLEKDVEMMKKAGINLVRIAEYFGRGAAALLWFSAAALSCCAGGKPRQAITMSE